MNIFKKLIFLGLMLTVILACQIGGEATAPAAEAVQEEAPPAPAPTEVPPTVVPPTNTPIPEPTAVPIPQSGDLLYETTFEDIADWDIATLNNEAGYKNDSRSDGLYVKVPDKNDFWLAYYPLIGDGNVRMEADVELIGGTNYTLISLICRTTETGMYYFELDTGGYWHIGKYDFDADNIKQQLDGGASNKISVAKNPNHMTATCNGDELTLEINGRVISSVQDSQFSEGGFGIGVDTFDYPLAEVMFHKLEVYVP